MHEEKAPSSRGREILLTEADQTALHAFLNAYKEISKPDMELICGQMQVREVKAGEILLNTGKIARELFFIVGGILKIISHSEKGNEVIQFFVKEHKLCTILYSFNNDTPSHEGIVAATDSRLLVLTKPRLTACYQQLAYLKGLIESITQKALLDKIQIRNRLMGEEATVRYQKFLEQQPDIITRVPLSDVASYLGITPQSLSRIRRNITNGSN